MPYSVDDDVEYFNFNDEEECGDKDDDDYYDVVSNSFIFLIGCFELNDAVSEFELTLTIVFIYLNADVID